MNFFSSERYPKILLVLSLAAWLFFAISPFSRFDWFLDNLPVFVFVPLLVFTYNRFRFSNFSYTLFFLFFILHLIGAHYTYGQVPIDWSVFGFERNHYDRLVHFLNGLLLFYPVREFISRKTKISGAWSYFFPFATIMAASALYEILEWTMAVIFSPDAVELYLGAQGDQFDEIKDMLMAWGGAMIAVFVVKLQAIK